MANNLTKLTTPTNAYAQADTVNHHGFPAFSRDLKEQYVQLLLTNTVGGTFYASESELVDATFELHGRMLADDPAFMAKAVVYARSEGFMRLQPIVGLVYLSTLPDKGLFNTAFKRVIQTPGDLQDFVALVRGKRIRKGLGRSVKEAINQYLLNLSEYHAMKYGTGGQGYGLGDILRLTRPKGASPAQNEIFKWLLGKSTTNIPNQLLCLEQVKVAKTDEEILFSIRAGRLPYEVVTGIRKPSQAVWHELMRQMPVFALLRHLEKFTRDELWTAENLAFVLEKINPISIKNAKILPFRIWSAYAELQTGQKMAPRELMAHLATLLDAAAAECMDIEGKVCVALDVSGSMDGKISDKSSVSCLQIGALLMAMVNVNCKFPILMEFDDEARVIDYLPPNIVPAVQHFRTKGGTNLEVSIQRLMVERKGVDVFIGITDSEHWAGNRGFLNVWHEYKRTFPSAKAFLIQIAPSRGLVAPSSEPDVYYIYGWADTVLKFIAMQQQGLGGQVQYVEGVNI